MEAARYAKFLKPDGKMVINRLCIPSLPVLSGQVAYPEHIIESLKKDFPVLDLDATRIATEIGNPKSANVVLLGALVQALGLTNLDWSDFISRTVKPKFVDVNLKAFQKGREAVAGGER